jgi:hypothetical protein
MLKPVHVELNLGRDGMVRAILGIREKFRMRVLNDNESVYDAVPVCPSLFAKY